jgi:magnesium transporter
MNKMLKKRSKKAGLPPGTLVHIGEEKADKTRIHVSEYDEQNFQEEDLPVGPECFLFPKPPKTAWINITGIHQTEVVEQLGTCFDLHPLLLEDVLNTDQRPKLEDFGENLFIVLKALSYSDQTGEISSDQVSLVLRPNALVSFQEREADLFAPVEERLRNGKGRGRKMGPDYLAYRLIDIIVDRYFIILEKLGERIEGLEEKLIGNPTPRVLQEIQKLKRNLLALRRWVWPLREVISALERGEQELFQDSTRIYLRDVYDHTIQVMDTIEIFRDILSGMLDIYLSSISNRMNAVMKVLTIITTIFMPLTFIAGIYGMNFEFMPELKSPWGYPLVLIAMAGIAGMMLGIFKRKKWL